MRKSPTLLALLIAALTLLAACQAPVASSASSAAPSSAPAPSSSPAPASSAAPSSAPAASAPAPSATDLTGFVNTALPALIGQPLPTLEADYGQDFFLYDVGSTTAAMEYYDPFICFYFTNFISYKEAMTEAEMNPFIHDESTITSIQLQAEVDPATFEITDQDSLRRLFTTEEPLTYTLLEGALGQSPPLVHSPEGGFGTVTPYEIGGSWTAMPGGTYDATFTVEGADILLTFCKSGGDYALLRAGMS